MTDNHADILPNIGLGGLKLGQELDLKQWSSANQFPQLWEVSCAELDAYMNHQGSVVAFLDQAKTIRGLYATPRYFGTLFGSIRTGMTGRQAVRIRPSLYFWSLYACLRDYNCGGYYLTVEEIDLDEEDFLEKPMLFIGVFDQDDPRFH